MAKLFDGKSLLKEYIHFTSLVIVVVIFISLGLAYSTFKLVYKEREEVYISDSLKIAIDLQESFKYLERSLNFIANKIAEVDVNNLKNVESVLKKSTKFPRITEDTFTWTMFDFVDPSGYIAVDSIRGIIEHPIKIDSTKRSWFDLARTRPWRLHFSSPDIGLNSGEEIIPTGYGFTDTKNNFLGIISIGFNIKKFSQKINNILSHSDSVFIIVDSSYNEVAKSKLTGKYGQSELSNKLKNLNINSVEMGYIDPPIIYEETEYRYFRKVKFSPFTILMGDKQITIKSELQRAIFPQFLITSSLILFFLIIIYFFKNKIINPIIQLSNAADMISQGKISDIKLPVSNSLEMKNIATHLSKIVTYTNELQTSQDDLALTKKSLHEALDTINEIKKPRDIFIANLAYSLKVPARKVISHADYLIKNISSNDPNNPLLTGWKEVANNAKYIQTLILDLLEYTKSDKEEILLNEAIVDVEEEVEYCIDILKSYAAQNFVDIDVKYGNYVPKLFGDELRIKQILINLISNAIINSPRSSIIIINVSFDEDLTITIKDQRYKNMNTDFNNEKNHLLEENEHISEIAQFSIMIAKRLVKLHDGTIVISSIPDYGDVVSVHFPKHKIFDKISE